MSEKDLTIKEDFAIALQNHQKSNFKVAEKIYKKILEINPYHFKSIFYFGVLSLQTNNFDEAKRLFQQAIQIKPDYAPTYNNLGLIFYKLKEIKKAIISYQKAIKIQPDFAPAHNNLGMVFRDLGEFEKATSSYEIAIKIQPNYGAAHLNLGVVFKKMGKHQKAISCFQKTIQFQTNYGLAYYNLGAVFQELGEFEKAISSYQMAVKYEPENMAHLYYLSSLKKEILDSNLKNKIYEITERKNSTKKNIAYGNLLLSKYELKAKNYEKEFNHLLKGHYYYFEAQDLQFKTRTEYWLNVLPNIDELINLDQSSENINKKDNKIYPIFIIGVPRCGSTLVEKIIASGNRYIPIGEETEILNFFISQNIQQNPLLKTNIEYYQYKIIEKYKQKGLVQEKSNYTFTDKSLHNFFYIGLIKQIFPYAKVINCQRSALSCIMSILKNNLAGLSWAHNLEHIFKYFDIYYKMIANFKKFFPNFIYELQYEKLVDNPKIESKKLMEFCDLPWDKKCLEFYKRKDLVSQTASNVQIRRAIYKNSIQKYLPYKQLLNKYGNEYQWFN